MNKILEFIIPENVTAITLYPFGIYYRKTAISERTLYHEIIHWNQQKEMLCIFFYIWYVFEWLIKLIKYGSFAYMNISFEREAYHNDGNKLYIFERKWCSWFKYL